MRPNLTPAKRMPGGAANKMFIIAGPAIVYGVSASVVYGFIYWLTTVLYYKKQNNQIAKSTSTDKQWMCFLLYFLRKNGSELDISK